MKHIFMAVLALFFILYSVLVFDINIGLNVTTLHMLAGVFTMILVMYVMINLMKGTK